MSRDPKTDPQPGDEFEDKHGHYRITVVRGSVVHYRRKWKKGPHWIGRTCPLSGWPSLAEGLTVVKAAEVKHE